MGAVVCFCVSDPPNHGLSYLLLSPHYILHTPLLVLLLGILMLQFIRGCQDIHIFGLCSSYLGLLFTHQLGDMNLHHFSTFISVNL